MYDEGGAGRGRKVIGRKPVNLIVGWCGRFLFFVVPRQFSRVGWFQLREKIDWQEGGKFDCRLVRTIFIFYCPSSIFLRPWRVARKSNFDF